MKHHTYKGSTIYRCDCNWTNPPMRWFVQTYHSPTGMPWEEQICPHFANLKDARKAINWKLEVTA